MLKRKEWLKRYKQLMLDSGVFDPFIVNLLMLSANMEFKGGLSPGEAAKDQIEFWEDLQYAFKSGS